MSHFSFLDCTPESIFSSKAEHQVDLQRKLQEDPLLTLRKKELDTRKRLLDNPIKMKQIQAYVRFINRLDNYIKGIFILHKIAKSNSTQSQKESFIKFPVHQSNLN
jgi:hypothetical protein